MFVFSMEQVRDKVEEGRNKDEKTKSRQIRKIASKLFWKIIAPFFFVINCNILDKWRFWWLQYMVGQQLGKCTNVPSYSVVRTTVFTKYYKTVDENVTERFRLSLNLEGFHASVHSLSAYVWERVSVLGKLWVFHLWSLPDSRVLHLFKYPLVKTIWAERLCKH